MSRPINRLKHCIMCFVHQRVAAVKKIVNRHSINRSYFATTVLVLLLSAQPTYAGCNRDDVDYYLSKGFTPAQIAAVCSDTTTQGSTTVNAVPIPKPFQSTEEQLQSFMAGEKISLNEDSLNYIQEICVAYEYDAYYPPDQVVCPRVQVSILRKGLKVLKTESLIFDGDRVVVTGSISLELLDTFTEKAPEERKLIQAAFSQNKQTHIQLKNEASATELAEVLRKIGR